MSISKKRLKYFLKDETKASGEYAKTAQKAVDDEMERMFMEMSRDEHKHAGYLIKMMKEGKLAQKACEGKPRENRQRRRVYNTYLFDDVDD